MNKINDLISWISSLGAVWSVPVHISVKYGWKNQKTTDHFLQINTCQCSVLQKDL